MEHFTFGVRVTNEQSITFLRKGTFAQRALHKAPRVYWRPASCFCESVVNRWLVISVSALLLLGAGGVAAFLFNPLHPIQVVGSLPSNDLAEIKRVVRYTIATSELGHSWRNGWKIPRAIGYYAAHPIVRIEVQTNNLVKVLFKRTELRGDIGYILRKGANGWRIETALFL